MVFSNEREVTFVDNPVMVQPLLDFLRSNGVDAHLTDEDDMGGLNPALAFVHGTWIHVPVDQVPQAEELISAFRAAPLTDADETGLEMDEEG